MKVARVAWFEGQMGAGLWPLYASSSSDVAANLLTVTLQMLSALTVPHILLDHIAARHQSRSDD